MVFRSFYCSDNVVFGMPILSSSQVLLRCCDLLVLIASAPGRYPAFGTVLVEALEVKVA